MEVLELVRQIPGVGGIPPIEEGQKPKKHNIKDTREFLRNSRKFRSTKEEIPDVEFWFEQTATR